MSQHKTHAIRRNSIAARYQEREHLSRRKDQVLAVYARARRPLRDREVMQALGFVDMNSIRPVVTALIDKKVLHEVGDTVDPITKRTVRLVALQSYDDPQMKIFFRERNDGGGRRSPNAPNAPVKVKKKGGMEWILKESDNNAADQRTTL
jgi:hypothetical protein